MSRTEALAAIRFGTGLSATEPPPPDAEALIDRLSGPDRTARRHRIAGFDTVLPSQASLVWMLRTFSEARGTPEGKAVQEARTVLQQQIALVREADHRLTLARAVDARYGLRERLTQFWADHFTVVGRRGDTRHLVSPFVEDAIRPHVAGRFPDMLRAVVTHPMMLMYLDQPGSVGPDSETGGGGRRGLNENLARELLELHLVGVQGGYDQSDVTALAELLTGLTYQPMRGFAYDPRRAQPGAETVLGLTFGAEPELDTVLSALDELAMLPQTARHLARSLAAQFVAPDPAPPIVEAMAEAYLASDGSLLEMTAAMLRHRLSWDPEMTLVRWPQEFLVAAFRALGVEGQRIVDLNRSDYRRIIERPMALMGQPWQRPNGPDGYPDRPEAWVIPQTMAARIGWAMQVPERLVDPLPDPRAFAATALGDLAPQEALFAARAAETVAQGVGVVLASAAFQRR